MIAGLPRLADRRRILAAGLALAAGGLALQLGAAQAQPPAALPPIERLVVLKSERRLLAYAGGQVVHVFEHIQLGDNPVGPKQFRGDEKTPEGAFVIDYGNRHGAAARSICSVGAV